MPNPLNWIDRFLNNITMYRFVMDFLIVLVGVAAIFGSVGILPYNPIALIFSTLFLVAVCWIVNETIAKIFDTQTNKESAYITALILALIITPGMDLSTIAFMAWAGTIAMASKYVLAIDRKHIFNPAAFGVAIPLIASYIFARFPGATAPPGFDQAASWWIGGNLPMLAFVLIGGLLMLRKVQRFDLSPTFFFAALASCVVTHPGFDPIATITKTVTHTPIFFFATIMITEPLTTPPTRPWRIAYGALVGALFSPTIAVAGIHSTPELALLIGNIFSFAVSPKGKQMLTLKEKTRVSNDLYHFTFAQEKKLAFRPGQYMEWTLGHAKADDRGNRRYFTIASAPTENTVQLGVKFYEPSSTFKKALGKMRPGDTILAGQLAGDFTLPRNAGTKLAFIAGGIGVTPFRSMVKDLVDRREKRDVVLFYSNRNADEVAYRELFDEAERTLGIRTFYILTEGGQRLTGDMIRTAIPDYRDRIFYVSGTHAMTTAFRETLRAMGVPITHIRTDFFPGFA